jgi:hypothetical protein
VGDGRNISKAEDHSNSHSCSKYGGSSKKIFLAFHAITGCDVTSYLAGISKKNAWKTYLESSHLLSALGNIPLSENSIANVEEFVVRL